MNITFKDFFKPINLTSHSSFYNYRKAQPYIRSAEALAQVTHHSIYLIDYYRRSFLYVSDNPLFLCGRQPKEILKAGYLFYLENVPEEDLELILKIKEAGFKFYYDIPTEKKFDYSISYDFRLWQPNGELTIINHKATPLVLDEDANIWIALCVVSPSSNSNPGNVIIKNAITNDTFHYDLISEKWQQQNPVSLNAREKQIINLSIQGLTAESISQALNVSVNTIKFHRKTLFKKLNASSISEAIFAAVNYGLL